MGRGGINILKDPFNRTKSPTRLELEEEESVELLPSSHPIHHPHPHSHSHQQPLRYTSTLYRNTFTLLLLLYTLIALFFLYWVTRFFFLRHDAYAHSVFALPMIPTPVDVEGLVPVVDSRGLGFQDELDTRLEGLGLPRSSLKCEWGDADEERFRGLKDDGPYLFALNLWNNQVVFPTLSRTLLSLSNYLGTENVFISIFENGSTDNTTLAMANFASVLTAAGVDHRIVSDKRKTNWKKVDRIAQLSVYRNVALEALKEREFKDVVFVNDVFVCERDALELLYQKRLQGADATCGMDWRETKSWWQRLGLIGGSVKYYDNWVGRTITGDMFRPRLDPFSETRNGLQEIFTGSESTSTRERFQKVLPFPVYSCWNGMLAISAKPFTKTSSSSLEPIKFRSAFNTNECAASECKLVAKDFWARGLKKWVVVPSVHVTYTQQAYTHPLLQSLKRPSTTSSKTWKSETEVIDWEDVEGPKSVVCYEYLRGFHIDTSSRELPY